MDVGDDLLTLSFDGNGNQDGDEILASLPRRAPKPSSPHIAIGQRHHNDAYADADPAPNNFNTDVNHFNKSHSFSDIEQSSGPRHDARNHHLPSSAGDQRDQQQYQITSAISNLSRSEVEAMVDAAERAAFASKLAQSQVTHSDSTISNRDNSGYGFSPQPPPSHLGHHSTDHTNPNPRRSNKYSSSPRAAQHVQHQRNSSPTPSVKSKQIASELDGGLDQGDDSFNQLQRQRSTKGKGSANIGLPKVLL